MDRTAPTDHPILPAISKRWAPRSYLDTPVSEADLRTVLEAARWTASAYNEQPWIYLVTRKAEEADAYAKLLACLVPFNQSWAASAPVLMLACARLNSAGNGKPNAWALYDTGQASSAMSIQAASMDLHIHQMAGFDAAAAREAFGIPEDVMPISAMVLGSHGPASALPEKLAEREVAPRSRKDAGEIFFGGSWGKGF
ncbi:MAG: nitroreductase [Rubritepida sp.]|nr:nitroreductase [Rubritepida sp.]